MDFDDALAAGEQWAHSRDDDASIVHWFGPTWNARINLDCPEEPTPVGVLCLRCKQPIEADDRGVTMLDGTQFDEPFRVLPSGERVAVHIDCHIASVLSPTTIAANQPFVPTRKLSQECVCRDCGQPSSLHGVSDPEGCNGWL